MSAIEDGLKDLLVGGLRGDAVAYHAFLKALSSHLRAFLRGRLSGLPDDVEDLVQETLIAMHNQRHTYDASQPLTSWAHAIAKYKLIDLLRRRQRHDLLNDPLDDLWRYLQHPSSSLTQPGAMWAPCSRSCLIDNACLSFT